jgi:hypothetical protein
LGHKLELPCDLLERWISLLLQQVSTIAPRGIGIQPKCEGGGFWANTERNL